MKRRLVLFLLALGAVAARAFAQQTLPPASLRPGREISLPSSQVKDTFFAYVLGIIKAGAEVDVDNVQMREILTEFKSTLDVPFDLIARVTQHTDSDTGVRVIGMGFKRDVVIPIPFALLWYHPGSITASRDLVFQVLRSTYRDPSALDVAAPVFDLVLTHGTVLIDIDDWLEVLLRAYLEDTWIRHLVFFTWHGDWIGLLEGSGRDTGRSMRAYFNFTRNRILFPVPAALDQAGKAFISEERG